MKKNISKIKIKTVETLEIHDCRWPIGDPRQAGFHFCGAPQEIGRPYCTHHWEMSFISAKQRQQAAQRGPLIAFAGVRKAA